MNRTVVMTLGFLLIFFGIQLNVVDSYVLTPRMANFLSDQLSEPSVSANGGVVDPQTGQPVQSGQFAQVGFSPNEGGAIQMRPNSVNRVIRPPGWIGWPIMFLGAVFFLNGLSIRQ